MCICGERSIPRKQVLPQKNRHVYTLNLHIALTFTHTLNLHPLAPCLYKGQAIVKKRVLVENGFCHKKGDIYSTLLKAGFHKNREYYLKGILFSCEDLISIYMLT